MTIITFFKKFLEQIRQVKENGNSNSLNEII